jgi:hypothetical protein
MEIQNYSIWRLLNLIQNKYLLKYYFSDLNFGDITLFRYIVSDKRKKITSIDINFSC